VALVSLAAQLDLSADQPGARPAAAAEVRPPRMISGGFYEDDYPAAARRARHSGTSVHALAIDVRGRVTGCTVTQSSGHALLDATTCRILQRRFRFAPARLNGKPVAGTYTFRMRWPLPG
jgi:protein TonB